MRDFLRSEFTDFRHDFLGQSKNGGFLYTLFQ